MDEPAATDGQSWLAGLPVDDDLAARLIYEECFDRLVGMARSRIGAGPRRASDEEDLASSVLGSFFRGVDQGRFSGRLSRAQLWGLLMTILRRKVAGRHRAASTLRRGGGREVGECDGPLPGREPTPLDELAATLDCPSSIVAVKEALWLLIRDLKDPVAESVVLLRLSGHSQSEIATRLGCTSRTVERKSQKVRRTWLRVDAE